MASHPAQELAGCQDLECCADDRPDEPILDLGQRVPATVVVIGVAECERGPDDAGAVYDEWSVGAEGSIKRIAMQPGALVDGDLHRDAGWVRRRPIRKQPSQAGQTLDGP